MDVVIDVLNLGVYPFQLNRYAYEQTTPEWPLRQLLTDLLVYYGDSKYLNEHAGECLTRRRSIRHSMSRSKTNTIKITMKMDRNSI